MMDGEEVQLKPDALAHLADALMEDIVATPPHQLAIEEIVDAGRSRELLLRFDDILAEAISSSSGRPTSLGSCARWNLTDALCEDMAARPDETAVTEVSGDRSDDHSLAGKFDDILRRDPHLAMAGLKLPRQPSPTHPALLYVKATLARLLDRLTAPLHRRASAGAFAAVVTAAVMTAVVYQPSRETVEPDRFAAAAPESPKPPVVARSAQPVVADGGNAGRDAKSGDFQPPPAIADGGGMRLAAAAPELPVPPAVARPEPPAVLGFGGNAGSAAKSEASPPPAIAADGGRMRVAAAPPESPKPSAVLHFSAPPRVPVEGGNAGSAAKSEASPQPPANAADGGGKRVAAGRTQAAAAVSPAAVSAPDPERRRGTAERSAFVSGRPATARPAAPGIDGPLTPSDLPTAPLGMPGGLSAWSTPTADIENELKTLEELARNGDIVALWKLGRIYADGDGVPQNHLRGFDYFRRITDAHAASDVGDARHPVAQFIAIAFVQVGRYYLTGIANSDISPDPPRAHQMFVYAAVNFGDPDAQYELGRTFLDGVGVTRDQKQGARWLYQAAIKGQYEAQAKFGSLLFVGQVIPRDAAKGLMWLKIAMDTAPRAAAASITEIYDAAAKQATEEERAAASVYFEQWRRSRKSP
jgi:uncharacterized protein